MHSHSDSPAPTAGNHWVFTVFLIKIVGLPSQSACSNAPLPDRPVLPRGIHFICQLHSGRRLCPRFHSPAELEALQQRVHSPLVPGEWYMTSASCRGSRTRHPWSGEHQRERRRREPLFALGKFHDGTQREGSALAGEGQPGNSSTPDMPRSCRTKSTSCHAPMGRYSTFSW